jgi:hypothetical protein
MLHVQKERRYSAQLLLPIEPLLLKCNSCGLQFSSQHLTRQLLLACRPTSWPSPLVSFSEDKWIRKAIREAGYRLDIEASKLHIWMREKILSTLTSRDEFTSISEEQDTAIAFVLSNLRCSNTTTNEYCRPDDDIILNDEILQRIQMLPSSTDDQRMSESSRRFMIACLVAQKICTGGPIQAAVSRKSKMNLGASVCRYNFP